MKAIWYMEGRNVHKKNVVWTRPLHQDMIPLWIMVMRSVAHISQECAHQEQLKGKNMICIIVQMTTVMFRNVAVLGAPKLIILHVELIKLSAVNMTGIWYMVIYPKRKKNVVWTHTAHVMHGMGCVLPVVKGGIRWIYINVMMATVMKRNVAVKLAHSLVILRVELIK
jgi:hypothetical protein